jgi:glycosyltransferase involved in cell wall biosynthesis
MDRRRSGHEGAVALVLASGSASAEPTAEHLQELGIASRVVAEDALAATAEAVAPADVVVVRAGARLAPGALDRLAEAAAAEAVATARAISLGTETGDAALVAARSLRLRPRSTRQTLDCTWINRAALQLAGPLDDGFSDRCSAAGLVHVVADDVLALGVPATDAADPLDAEYSGGPPRPPTRLSRALTWTRRVVDGLEVTIDGRALRSGTSGTEVQALALIHALERTGAVRLRVLVEDGVALDGIRTIANRELEGRRRTAIVHRPYQVAAPDDITRLAHVGERLVLTHLDLLLFHNPTYHANPTSWAVYRQLTRSALAMADAVVAISRTAEEDLLAEDLVDRERLTHVPLGIDHERGPAPTRPDGLLAVADRPFIVQLGTDLRHKNRPFAIALVRELRALGWPGVLVLAGPSAEHGSSRELEAELPGVVIRLDAVTDAERRWLYREAAAVAYPSTSEGFGLVPFEAAAEETPALVAPVSALAELLGPELAALVPWDARASARRALPLLTDPAEARRHVQAVREAGATLTWDATAAALLEVYDRALASPARAAATAAMESLAAEARRAHWEGTYWALRDEIGPTGFALVGSDGALDEEAQRALVALARRPLTRRAVLGALRAARKAAR